MPTLNIDISVSFGNDVKSGRTVASQDGGVFDDVTLTASQSNKQVLCPFKTTDLTAGALVIVTDRSITVKTNSTSAPDNTWSIAAGTAYIVPSLAADITSLYITNNDSANGATVYIRGVRDVTP